MPQISHDKIGQKLSENEAKRQLLMRRYKFYKSLILPARIAVGIGILMLISTAVVPFVIPFLLPFLIVAVIVFVGYIIVRLSSQGNPKKRFQKQFKEDFLPWLIRQFYPGFSYAPGDTFPLEELNRSLLFGTKLSERKGEDMVRSEEGRYTLRFSELCLTQRKESLKEFAGEQVDEIVYGMKSTPSHLVDDPSQMIKVFEGVVCQVQLPNAVAGSLIVRTRGKGWSELYREYYLQGRERVETGDTTFDALFEVFVSQDHPALANEWLTPQFRSHMVQVQDEKAQPLAFSLFEDRLYWAIPVQTNLLEAELHHPLPDLDAVQVYVDQVEHVRNAAVGWVGVKHLIEPDKGKVL